MAHFFLVFFFVFFEKSSSFCRENEIFKNKKRQNKKKLDQFLTLEKAKIGPVFNSTAHICISLSLSLSPSLSLSLSRLCLVSVLCPMSLSYVSVLCLCPLSLSSVSVICLCPLSLSSVSLTQKKRLVKCSCSSICAL